MTDHPSPSIVRLDKVGMDSRLPLSDEPHPFRFVSRLRRRV